MRICWGDRWDAPGVCAGQGRGDALGLCGWRGVWDAWEKSQGGLFHNTLGQGCGGILSLHLYLANRI